MSIYASSNQRMKSFAEIDEIRKLRTRHFNEKWGLVPTMGDLHAGHISLVKKAKMENDRVGVSIFVNPIQFNSASDLQAYPRNLERDLNILAKEGVDLVWTPLPEAVYPEGYQTYVVVETLAQKLEGEFRPGHFKGVVTIVARLFNIFQPNQVYFGQKDAQQVLVVRKMIEELNFPVKVITCPTVREPDGLAMSSRNSRLSSSARKKAASLYQALIAAQKAYEKGERDAIILKSVMVNVIHAANIEQIDYVSVADQVTLEELERISGGALLSLAIVVGGVRLIDNIVVGN